MKRLLLPSIFLSAALLWTACGQEGGQRSPAAGPAGDLQPAKPPVVFRLLHTNKIESLDPHFAETPAERHLSGALFEGLVNSGPEGRTVLPGLAEKWTVSGDGKTYTFTLRETVWTDGTALTAQTVKDSWLRLINPVTDSPYAWLPAEFIQGAAEYNAGKGGPEVVQIEAVSSNTLQLKCTGNMVRIEELLTHTALAAVPVHTVRRYGAGWTDPAHIVCSGAFDVGGRENGRWVLHRNGEYWDRNTVGLSEIRARYIPDMEKAFSQYRGGNADWLARGFRELPPGMEEHQDLHIFPGPAAYYYIFQTERPPLNDVRVRKALALAVDKPLLAAVPAGGIVPPLPGYPGPFTPEDGLSSGGGAGFDPEAARDYLNRAGYPKGAGFPTIEILYNSSDEHEKIGKLVKKQWQENLGISCSLEEKKWESYLAYRRAGEFQLVRAGWRSDFADPRTFLSIFVSGNPYNCGRYSNPEFDALMSEAAEKSGPERLAVFARAEHVLIYEDQAVLPLFYYSSSNFIDTEKWGGWKGNVMDYHPLKKVYLNTAKADEVKTADN